MEYLQTWKQGNREMILYFDFKTDRYIIIGRGEKTLKFTDIYDANNYMYVHGWK